MALPWWQHHKHCRAYYYYYYYHHWYSCHYYYYWLCLTVLCLCFCPTQVRGSIKNLRGETSGIDVRWIRTDLVWFPASRQAWNTEGAFHWAFSGGSLAMHESAADRRCFLQWNTRRRFLGRSMVSMVITVVTDHRYDATAQLQQTTVIL